MAMQTQWRWLAPGMGDPVRTGLDYAGVCAWLQAQGYRAQSRRGALTIGQILDDLRECESVALDAWARQAARKRG